MKTSISLILIICLGCNSIRNIQPENAYKNTVFEELGITAKLPSDWKVKRDFTATKYNYIAESPINDIGEYNSIYFSYEYIPEIQFQKEYNKLVKSILDVLKMTVEEESDCQIKQYNCKKILSSSSSNSNITHIISDKGSEKRYIIIASTFYKEKAKELENLKAVLKEISINDSQEISKGHELYIQQCASCHGLRMNKNLTGPALAGISERRNSGWIKSFIRDSQLLYENKDSIAIQIIDFYGGQEVRCGSGNKRELTDIEIEALIKYIEYEANNATKH